MDTEQSTKPNGSALKEEVIAIPLRPDGHTSNIIHDSVGCKHEFIQKTANTVECNVCGLGLYARVRKGKLTMQ